MSPLRIRSQSSGKFPMKRAIRSDRVWIDSKCKSLITTAFIVSLCTVIQNAEAGHSAYAPGGLECWSNSIADLSFGLPPFGRVAGLGVRNADCPL
jgi:hypothetical protein